MRDSKPLKIHRQHSWWRQVLALQTGIMVCLISTIVSAQQISSIQRPSQALIERQMSAAEQLKAYQHRITSTKKGGARGTDATRKDVGITINSETKTSSTIFFYDNIEGGLNGWTSTAYTGSDLWHQSTLEASSPTHSWWPGIELQSDYNNGARVNSALISPSINLVGGTGPIRLLFAESFVTERGWDYCMVDVSTDGGSSWTQLRGGYGTAPSGDTEGWQVTALDLTPYSGSTIKLRFYFDTGDANFNNFPGWFIDDIVIFDQGGQITGKKFFDVNNNSVKDLGERGVKDWYITATGPVTITTKTNYRGRYWFTLPLGSYTVSEAFQANWTQKYPLAGTWNINLASPDTLADSVHFGNYTQASFIKGIKFNDIDRNGIFDNSDTSISEWRISLCDTNGNEIDFDRSDSTGMYELYVFQPGTYIVKEVSKQKWVQTYPSSETYTVVIPDLNTTVVGRDFGNYYSDSANTLVGQKYEDLNKNHLKDLHEPGVSGVRIQLSGTKSRTVVTDTNGYYAFHGLPAGSYKVKEVPQIGWWKSAPDSFYTVTCFQGQYIDTLDFGNYQITTGSIGGMKFYDENTNATKDNSETGLSGWHILINGFTYFNTSVNQTAITNGSGTYSFAGIWPGTYTVSEVWRNGWTQTLPANLAPYHINLGPEENRTDVDFGNVDSVLTIGTYRTFKSNDLAFAVNSKNKHIPVPNKPDKDEFWATFENPYPDSATMIRVHFGQAYAVGTLSATGGGIITPVGTKNKVIDIALPTPVAAGESVVVHGFLPKPKFQTVNKWTLFFHNDSAKPGSPEPVMNILRHPMPNGNNLLAAVGNGLKVGLGGPHSVVHSSYKDVINSLFEKPDRTHIGLARCLDNFSGVKPKSIKKQQKVLPPKKHNNRLFGEAIALQVNIIGSDAGVLPPGFGNLVFDDGTGLSNPLNGMPIRTIAAVLDSFMSSPVDTGLNIHGCVMPLSFGAMDPETLYAKIRMIDSAFAGPIDTNSFATGLQFKGVHQITEVPFLRYDPVMALKQFAVPPGVGEYIPDQYALYQNYPNPFNPTTTISFTLSQPSVVTLKIYNILGQEVAALLSRESMEDGSQEIDFDANNLPSGVYFYHLVAEGVPDEDGMVGQSFSAVRKMLLIK